MGCPFFTESSEYRSNSKALYAEMFDYDVVYDRIEAKLNSLAGDLGDGQ